MRGNTNPRKRPFLTAAAAILITVLVLSGCASLNPFKPSALTLTKDALTNIGKIKSGKADYIIDSVFPGLQGPGYQSGYAVECRRIFRIYKRS